MFSMRQETEVLVSQIKFYDGTTWDVSSKEIKSNGIVVQMVDGIHCEYFMFRGFYIYGIILTILWVVKLLHFIYIIHILIDVGKLIDALRDLSKIVKFLK